MKFEIVIRTGGRSEEEITELRRKARMEALEIRIDHPEAQIFFVELEEKGKDVEVRRIE